MIAIIIFILYLMQIVIGFSHYTQENYTLYQVTAFNPRERAVLYSVQVENDNIIFLNGVTNEAATPMYVIVEERCIEDFESTMSYNDIEYIIVNKESVLDEFNNPGDLVSGDINNTNEQGTSLNEKFLDWDEIMAWVKKKDEKSSILEKIHLGETYERRELFVLKISSGSKRPAVFILGGEQGRDWMTPAIIINYINNMLLYEHETMLLDYYDLYFMPVFNPDGYEHSLKQDRFWNKNRKHFYPEKICKENEIAVGVNIDRNWFYTNSSNTPEAECNSVYIGHKALSEEEPNVVSKFLNSIAIDLMAFINLRGFVKLITVPYAAPYQANNFAILIEMLLHASAKSFAKYNVTYNICRTGDCLYNETGNCADWVKRNLNVPIVYTLYMKHEESFLPHHSQILKLMQHFATIMKESLILANSIYGPLFNCEAQMSSSFAIVLAIIVCCFNILLSGYTTAINTAN